MISGNQPTSDNVGSAKDVSGMVANVGVAVGIVSPAHSVQYLFPLPVSVAAILNSVDNRRHGRSGDIGNVISKSGLVENVGVEVEIASLSQTVQKWLSLPFFRPLSWIPDGRRRRIFPGMAPLKSPYQKMGGRHRIHGSSWSAREVRGGAKLHPPRLFALQNRSRCSRVNTTLGAAPYS